MTVQAILSIKDGGGSPRDVRSLLEGGSGPYIFAHILTGAHKEVPASSAGLALGTGAVGDILTRIIILPASTSPGAVSIKDGSGSAIQLFAGGTVGAELAAIVIEIGARSALGGWSITTGANVSVMAIGEFTA